MRKIDVIIRSEIYYPTVSVAGAKNAEMITLADDTAVDTIEVTSDVAEVKVDEARSREPEQKEPVVLVDAVKKMSEVKQRSRGLRVWGSRLGMLATIAVAVVAVTLVGLKLLGFRTFTVMSGSMEPNYPVGAMIYVQPVNYQDLKIGDVISYVANDDKTVVTHRIVEVKVDENDASVLRFRTKGDANDVADSNLVHYKNVLGTPIITIPLIGYIAHNIQQPPGIYIALVVGTLLLAWTFLPDTLEERRKTARKNVV